MNKSTIPALTSIRGIAALAVMFFHINKTHRGLAFFSLFENADLGVDLFFVLSGFILAYVYGRNNVTHNFLCFYRKFIILRITRIYPLHFATLLFTLVIVMTLPGFRERYPDFFFTKESFIANLFLIQNWGLWNISWNIVSWSISAEWFMYLLFPFLLYFKKYIKTNTYLTAIALLLIISHYMIIIAYNWEGYGGTTLGGMVRVFFEFCLGFFVFFLRKSFSGIFSFLHGYLGIFLLASSIISVHLKSVWFMFLPSVTLLIIHLSIIKCMVSSLLSRKGFVFLGNISFSLYMWHWLVIQLQSWLRDNGYITLDTKFLVYLSCISMSLISIIISYYSFQYIEEPVRKWGRKIAYQFAT